MGRRRGLEDEGVGYEHSSDNLREIIDAVLQDTRGWAAEGHEPIITWHTRSDDPLNVDDEIAALDLERPSSVYPLTQA